VTLNDGDNERPFVVQMKTLVLYLHNQFSCIPPSQNEINNNISFLKHIIKSAELCDTTVLVALAITGKVHSLMPPAQKGMITKRDIRLMFVAGFILSNKYLADEWYANRFWSDITGYKLNDLNKLEATFLKLLGYYINPDMFVHQLVSQVSEVSQVSQVSMPHLPLPPKSATTSDFGYTRISTAFSPTLVPEKLVNAELSDDSLYANVIKQFSITVPTPSIVSTGVI